MNREEAVLRELNLHPLWRLREGNGEAIGSPAAYPQRVLRESVAPVLVEAPMPVEAALPWERPPGREEQSAEAIQPAAQQAASETEIRDQEVAPATRTSINIGELAWPELKSTVRDCAACKLRAGCTQTVFGVGDEQADWLFVGEGPGADEDAQGEPFVGQAGKLLDNMLMAIQLKRGRNVYIANIVKCRPPGNRAPEAEEIASCLPYLQRQIALIQPKVIVALGKTAANALLGEEATLASLRGRLHDFNGTPLVITYHPAYLLHTPADKAKAWQDLCLAVTTMEG